MLTFILGHDYSSLFNCHCHCCCLSLTHWGRVTHIFVGNLTIIGSDYGLSPGRRQAIVWTNAGILLIGPTGTTFNEIEIEIHTFSFKKMHFKMSPCVAKSSAMVLYMWDWRICHQWGMISNTCAFSGLQNDSKFKYIFEFFNTLRPRRNKRHCADDILKCIFLNENVWISLKISLKFVSKFQINNIPA